MVGIRCEKHTLGVMAGIGVFMAVVAISVIAWGPSAAYADDTQEMYRLYNPYTGEHFYTASESERDDVRNAGWRYEGVGWIAPVSSSAPVYRMYNSYAGDHHYTMDAGECEALVAAGWTDEGTGWYSDEAKSVPVLRQYNSHAASCNHNYTTDQAENDALVTAGWTAEGVGWYAADAGYIFEMTPEQKAIQSLDGWWEKGTMAVDLVYHITGGNVEKYTRGGEYLGSFVIQESNVTRYDNGLSTSKKRAFNNTPGFYFDDLNMYLADGQPDTLHYVDKDGAHYSGGGSMYRK